MFDSESARLLRSAPEVPGLNPEEIPALLTRHYALLVSTRLNGDTSPSIRLEDEWSLERIADTYELVTSLDYDVADRRSAAFVAATAQQIIHRGQSLDEKQNSANVDRDRLDPTVAAALLFLIAEQYADASEAASSITNRGRLQDSIATTLCENISDLARGRPHSILSRVADRRQEQELFGLEEHALFVLLETLNFGVEIIAARLLGMDYPLPTRDQFPTAEAAFQRVLSISRTVRKLDAVILKEEVSLAYPGPHHLASLLLSTAQTLSNAALIQTPPPQGADSEIWHRWLKHRARSVPFVWPNHRTAISRGFYETGVSSIIVLPTGAGKTTLSSLKIAGVLARNKKVVFLAPTHALVEQLTDDLQDMFPKDIISATVSNDYDLVFQDSVQLQSIEVMTPERCLTMLSFAPEAFSEVALLVFDECHILSPSPERIRRSIDSMLCLLGFLHVASSADILFLSAMVKNGVEFAEWIGEQIERQCISVDLLWKPSRQARGVIVYHEQELLKAIEEAKVVQAAEDNRQQKTAVGLRKGARQMLAVRPWTIWGLQHNWYASNLTSYSATPLLKEKVLLAGSLKYGSIAVTPNANDIASQIATSASNAGLKTIVFVNTKKDAIKIANIISSQLSISLDSTEIEDDRWAALKWELGDLKHALLPKPMSAVPHNASMLRLERDLAERLFKRRNGANVIVATPTLAQGLNLPAHLAILAGDKRSRADKKGRKELEAHEILNAAARAGRAGHLANGMVLLIPEPVVTFSEGKSLKPELIGKLRSVLPEDDRCVTITDPLEVVLDRLMSGHQDDVDVQYLVNRLAALSEAGGVEDPSHMFDMRRSLAGFIARKKNAEQAFRAKVKQIRYLVAVEAQDLTDAGIITLASRSGLQISLLLKLRNRITSSVGQLPVSVTGWIEWCIDWLEEDAVARKALIEDVRSEILGACGLKKNTETINGCLRQILPGLIAWVEGENIASIEKKLGGNPEGSAATERVCPRSRNLVGTVIPRSITFIMSLIAHIIEDEDLFDKQDTLSRRVVACLGPATRKGYDCPDKMDYASGHRNIFSRVQIHHMWNTLGYA